MVGKLATHRRMVAAAEWKSRVCVRMGDLLTEMFPLVGRSG